MDKTVKNQKKFLAGIIVIFFLNLVSSFFSGNGIALIYEGKEDKWIIIFLVMLSYTLGVNAVLSLIERLFLQGKATLKWIAGCLLVVTYVIIFGIGSYTNLVFFAGEKVMRKQELVNRYELKRFQIKKELQLKENVLGCLSSLEALQSQLFQFAETEKSRDTTGPMYENYLSASHLINKKVDMLKDTLRITAKDIDKRSDFSSSDYNYTLLRNELINDILKNKDNKKENNYIVNYTNLTQNESEDKFEIKELKENFKRRTEEIRLLLEFTQEKIEMLKKAEDLGSDDSFIKKEEEMLISQNKISSSLDNYNSFLNTFKNTMQSLKEELKGNRYTEMPAYQNNEFKERFEKIYLNNMKGTMSSIFNIITNIENTQKQSDFVEIPVELKVLPLDKALYDERFNDLSTKLLAYFFDIFPLLLFIMIVVLKNNDKKSESEKVNIIIIEKNILKN